MLPGDGGLGKPHLDQLRHLRRYQPRGDSLLRREGDRIAQRYALQLRNHQVPDPPLD